MKIFYLDLLSLAKEEEGIRIVLNVNCELQHFYVPLEQSCKEHVELYAFLKVMVQLCEQEDIKTVEEFVSFLLQREEKIMRNLGMTLFLCFGGYYVLLWMVLIIYLCFYLCKDKNGPGRLGI